jgi:hypothetical protein
LPVCGPLHVPFGGRLDFRGALWLPGGDEAGHVLESLFLKAGPAAGLKDLTAGGLWAGSADGGGVAVLPRLRVVATFRLAAPVRWLRGSLSSVLIAGVLGAVVFAGLVQTSRLAGLWFGVRGAQRFFGSLFFGGVLAGEGFVFLVLDAVGRFGVGVGREFAGLGWAGPRFGLVRP